MFPRKIVNEKESAKFSLTDECQNIVSFAFADNHDVRKSKLHLDERMNSQYLSV